LLFNNKNGKANEPQRYVYKYIAYSFNSLDRDLNQESITIWSS